MQQKEQTTGPVPAEVDEDIEEEAGPDSDEDDDASDDGLVLRLKRDPWLVRPHNLLCPLTPVFSSDPRGRRLPRFSS